MRQEGLLFVNKKKQKNFMNFSPRWFHPHGVKLTKVFCGFFSKKQFLLTCVS
jgi:hypothetical protein